MNEENRLIIKQINKFGRVLETSELLKMIEELEKQNAELQERYNNMFKCHCNRVEVEKLQNNWNELKKWLESNHKYSEFEVWEILKKMQELEYGKDEL